MLRRAPVKKLSTHRTMAPSASSRSHKCEPRKPAPPVTKTRVSMCMQPPQVPLQVCNSLPGKTITAPDAVAATVRSLVGPRGCEIRGNRAPATQGPERPEGRQWPDGPLGGPAFGHDHHPPDGVVVGR